MPTRPAPAATRGFTLAQLLAVIAFTGTLSSIALPILFAGQQPPAAHPGGMISQSARKTR